MKNRSGIFKIIVFGYVCINLSAHTTYTSSQIPDQSIGKKIKTVLHAPRNFYYGAKALFTSKKNVQQTHKTLWFKTIKNQIMPWQNKKELLTNLLLNTPDLINEKDDSGQTALLLAVSFGNIDMVKTFIQAGANIEATTYFEQTPLLMAAHSGNSNAINALIQANANIYAKDIDGRTSLHLAAKSGNSDTIKALIQANANKEATDNNGQTPLHLAAQSGNSDAINALIQANANIEARNRYNNTPLHFAAYSGKSDAINAMIQAKANIKATNNAGQTPLHMAANCDNSDTINALIQAKANIAAIDNDGNTPLHIAATSYPEIEKLLINHGANLSVQNKLGQTSLQRLTNNHIPEGAWDYAINSMNLERIMHLLNYRPDLIDTTNSLHQTALFIAAKNNDSHTANALLVSYKANPNIPDNDGQTALHWAARSENESIITSLIQHGALNSPDNNGQSPIDITNSPAIKNLIIEQLISAHRQQSLFKANLKKLYEIYQHGDPTPLVQVLGGTTPIRQLTEIPQTTTQGARNFFNDLGILDPIINELNKLPGFAVPQNR